ncbi:hypothetical protein J6590_053699 [Homalodisca vitripennis]|nr:hypothetical protein J6590_053699 [Homalodisca vitripennis]
MAVIEPYRAIDDRPTVGLLFPAFPDPASHSSLWLSHFIWDAVSSFSRSGERARGGERELGGRARPLMLMPVVGIAA